MQGVEAIGNDIISNDGILNKREAEFVKQQVVQSFQPVADARSLLPPREISAGKQVVTFDRTDFDDVAEPILKTEDYPGIQTNGEEVTFRVAKIGKSFEIPREDLLSSQERNGQNLSTQQATDAATSVGQGESKMILQGHDRYGIPGLYPQAGTSVTSDTTSGWAEDEASASAIQSDIQKMKAELPDAAARRDLTLVVDRSDYEYANTVRGTDTQATIADVIEEEVETFTWSSFNKVDSALLMATGRDIAEYYIAEDMETVSEGEQPNDVVLMKVRLRSVPVIYKPSALVEMTGV